jgi:hypothetical protein
MRHLDMPVACQTENARRLMAPDASFAFRPQPGNTNSIAAEKSSFGEEGCEVILTSSDFLQTSAY